MVLLWQIRPTIAVLLVPCSTSSSLSLTSPMRSSKFVYTCMILRSLISPLSSVFYTTFAVL